MIQSVCLCVSGPQRADPPRGSAEPGGRHVRRGRRLQQAAVHLPPQTHHRLRVPLPGQGRGTCTSSSSSSSWFYSATVKDFDFCLCFTSRLTCVAELFKDIGNRMVLHIFIAILDDELTLQACPVVIFPSNQYFIVKMLTRKSNKYTKTVI